MSTENKAYQFQLKKILFPLIHSSYTDDEEKGYSILFRIEALILSSKSIDIVFGIGVSPQNQKKNTNSNQVLVEAKGSFEFTEEIFNSETKIEDVNSVEALPNMLAILFPFIREKIHYCFYNNEKKFHLRSQNTFRLVTDLKDKIKVHDLRKIDSSNL